MYDFRLNFPCIFRNLQIVIILAFFSVISCLFIQSVFIYSLIYNYALITPNVERFSVYVNAILSPFNCYLSTSPIFFNNFESNKSLHDSFQLDSSLVTPGQYYDVYVCSQSLQNLIKQIEIALEINLLT